MNSFPPRFPFQHQNMDPLNHHVPPGPGGMGGGPLPDHWRSDGGHSGRPQGDRLGGHRLHQAYTGANPEGETREQKLDRMARNPQHREFLNSLDDDQLGVYDQAYSAQQNRPPEARQDRITRLAGGNEAHENFLNQMNDDQLDAFERHLDIATPRFEPGTPQDQMAQQMAHHQDMLEQQQFHHRASMEQQTLGMQMQQESQYMQMLMQQVQSQNSVAMTMNSSMNEIREKGAEIITQIVKAGMNGAVQAIG